jgi:hypothetical protein
MYDAAKAWVVKSTNREYEKSEKNNTSKLTEWKRLRQKLHFSNIYNWKVIQERVGEM